MKTQKRMVRTLLWTAAATGAVALANALIFYRTPPLATAIETGKTRYYPTPTGDIFYQTAGEGPPLLLIHGIGAGESSFEFRHVFAALAENFTVYALDLPGFGKSDKPPIDYIAQTYIDLIEAFARDVIGAGAGGRKTDVLATSLPAAYVVDIAARHPDLFRRLALVEPTGIEELAAPVSALGAAIRGALRLPILGPSLYNAIAGRFFIRWYLKRAIYRDPSLVTEDLVTQYHVSAHQPGGDRVLPSFVTGFLNRNIRAAFSALVHPVLLVWGAESMQSRPERAVAFQRANPAASLFLVPRSGALPHEEVPAAFLPRVLAFLTD